MQQYIVQENSYLSKSIIGFYHTDYTGYQSAGNPDYVNILKNKNNNYSSYKLNNAVNELKKVLINDLPNILLSLGLKTATVCVVPRAKAKHSYSENQLLFSSTVSDVVEMFGLFNNGVEYITRHTNTRTTHLHRYDSDGRMPYKGITRDTCDISSNVAGKDIILVDDIYTKTINIDEDVIQSLLDNGAKTVCLYTIAKTVRKYN